MIIVICQGHSGSRLISQSLQRSGAWMGKHINSSGDIIPYDWPRSEPPLYEAARIINNHTIRTGYASWDFTPILSMRASDRWWAAVYQGIYSVVQAPEPSGWKLPETLFSLPWLIRKFPLAHYIRWVRDPRMIIAGSRAVDRYSRVGIPHKGSNDTNIHRAITYKYQFDLVEATPRPKYWLTVRYEDFVLKQEETLRKLSDFLQFDLKPVPVDPGRVYEETNYGAQATNLLRGGIEAWY